MLIKFNIMSLEAWYIFFTTYWYYKLKYLSKKRSRKEVLAYITCCKIICKRPLVLPNQSVNWCVKKRIDCDREVKVKSLSLISKTDGAGLRHIFWGHWIVKHKLDNQTYSKMYEAVQLHLVYLSNSKHEIV